MLKMYEQENEDRAVEKFVLEYRPLVRRIALYLKKRLPSHVDFDDLLQSGLVGLLEARANYNPAGGANFETFAKIRIQGSIIDSLRKNSWLTRETSKNMKLISDAISRLEQRTHQHPSSEDIAKELGITTEEHFKISQEISISNVMSIDEFENSDDQFGTDSENPHDINMLQNLKEQVKKVLAQLPKKEQLVLSLYYIDEFTFKQIGEILDLTEARVCQLHSQAIARVRSKMRTDL